MSHSESYGYLIIRITGLLLDRCLGTLDCSRALLTQNSLGPSRTVLDFGLKGRIPTFCLVLWLERQNSYVLPCTLACPAPLHRSVTDRGLGSCQGRLRGGSPPPPSSLPP